MPPCPVSKCCSPVLDHCNFCSGNLPSTLNITDSLYGSTTLTYNSFFSRHEGSKSVSVTTSIPALSCSSPWTTSTNTITIFYRLACSFGPPAVMTFAAYFPACHDNSGVRCWAQVGGSGSATATPVLTISSYANTSCASLDVLWSHPAITTIFNPLTTNNDTYLSSLYSSSGTIRIYV